MTREEAIRILDPETTVEALAEIEYYNGFSGKTAAVQAVTDACILAVADLRENEKSRWIPVTDERKPKDRRNYFIAYVFGDSDMHFFCEAKYHAYEGNGIVDRPHFSNEGVEGMRVTHWMEIPKLPQPSKGE